MNIETLSINKDIEVYKHFGWQITGTERRGGRHHHTYTILARDKDMENYKLLNSLQKEWEHYHAQLRTYEKAEGAIVLLLLLLFVIPGVIYIAYKSNEKMTIAENNYRINKKLAEIIKEADELL